MKAMEDFDGDTLLDIVRKEEGNSVGAGTELCSHHVLTCGRRRW